MLMEFKAGDRVRVLRLNTNEVDFYATLKDYNDGHPFILSDCSDGRFEYSSVFKPNTGEVGLNRWDYYVLAEDEEDKRTINDLDTNAYETRFITEDEEDTNGGNNMPTIKRKVEMNLPELIEWGFKNDIREKSFIAYECVEDQRHEVHFNALGIPKFSAFIKKSNTFTVEIEEQIDEETLIPKLIVEYSYCSDVDLYKCFKVGDFMNDNAKSIHILNDDLTTTLIWTREKGLIS